MNYGELKTRITGVSHRTDLVAQIPLFIEDARERINRRFGITLVAFVADADTNAVLTSYPLLYLYASYASLFEFVQNGDSARYYDQKFMAECDSQNVTQIYPTATQTFTIDSPPRVLTPGEQFVRDNP